MCSTVQEQITTCGQNAIVKIGERTNIRPQKAKKEKQTNFTLLSNIEFGRLSLIQIMHSPKVIRAWKHC